MGLMRATEKSYCERLHEKVNEVALESLGQRRSGAFQVTPAMVAEAVGRLLDEIARDAEMSTELSK